MGTERRCSSMTLNSLIKVGHDVLILVSFLKVVCKTVKSFYGDGLQFPRHTIKCLADKCKTIKIKVKTHCNSRNSSTEVEQLRIAREMTCTGPRSDLVMFNGRFRINIANTSILFDSCVKYLSAGGSILFCDSEYHRYQPLLLEQLSIHGEYNAAFFPY
jgi:hypothetical protein